MKNLFLMIVAMIMLMGLGACHDDTTPLSYHSPFERKDTLQEFQFNADGKFTILQLTDLHYDLSDYQQQIERNIALLVDRIQPDVIILTGDIVSGQPVPLAWWLFIEQLSKLETPYFLVLGNHDSEHVLNRDELYRQIEGFPYCMNSFYRLRSHSHWGDMVVPVYKSNNSEVGARLLLFDSQEYTPSNSTLGINEEQALWFQNQGQDLYPGGKTDILFAHVPIREYVPSETNNRKIVIGRRDEPEYGTIPNGQLWKILKANEKFCGMFCGHDHHNDYVAIKDNIALCYGRKTGSYNSYQKFPSGGRVIILDQNICGFSTYLIECEGDIFDHYTFTK